MWASFHQKSTAGSRFGAADRTVLRGTYDYSQTGDLTLEVAIWQVYESRMTAYILVSSKPASGWSLAGMSR
jgi:hypothetical protein